MFVRAGVFLLLFQLSAGRPERLHPDLGLDEKFSELIEADEQCASICALGGAAFDPENEICRCDRGLSEDGNYDTELSHVLMMDQTQASAINLLTTERSNIDKREIEDNAYFVGQKFQKKTPGKPAKNKKFTTRAPTPWRPKGTLKGKRKSTMTDLRSTPKPRRKFTPNPKLAEIHTQVEELKERLRAPRLGQRAAFDLEDIEKRHKKVIEELKEKQKGILKSRLKDKEKIVSSPFKKETNKQNNEDKIRADKKNDPHVASVHQINKENISEMPKKSKSELLATPHKTSSSTTPKPQKLTSSTTSTTSTSHYSSTTKSSVDPKIILTQMKEKISENKAKLHNRLAAESTSEKLTNVLEKNREVVSSTLKQIKEKQEKIKNRLTSSTTAKADIITQNPKLYQ